MENLQVIEEKEIKPVSLIQQAIEKGLKVDDLKSLFDLQERWEKNIASKEFLSALSNFQAGCPEIKKTKLVSFGNTKYKYATLGDIDEAIKSLLAENSLSKRWEIDDTGDKIICSCIISHASGHQERSSMSSQMDKSGNKNEIQSRASAITYLQRYTLIAALGISTADEDNDAQTFNAPPAKVQPIKKTLYKFGEDPDTLTPEWNNAIEALKNGKATIEKIREVYIVPVHLMTELESTINQTA